MDPNNINLYEFYCNMILYSDKKNKFITKSVAIKQQHKMTLRLVTKFCRSITEYLFVTISSLIHS